MTSLNPRELPVFVGEWKKFDIGQLFDLSKGKRLTKANQLPGKTPFIGASADNHGVTAFVGQKPIFRDNTITVSYNGSVGQVFYQEKPYWASDDINVLSMKREYGRLSRNLALFFCSCIYRAGQMFDYTDKWTIDKMKRSKIKLPVVSSGVPDFDYMEKYVSFIQQSAKLQLSSYCAL